jgi:hypothetical protein
MMRTILYRSSAYLVAAAAVIGGAYTSVSTLQISNAPVVDHVVAISVLQNVRPEQPGRMARAGGRVLAAR